MEVGTYRVTGHTGAVSSPRLTDLRERQRAGMVVVREEQRGGRALHVGADEGGPEPDHPGVVGDGRPGVHGGARARQELGRGDHLRMCVRQRGKVMDGWA